VPALSFFFSGADRAAGCPVPGAIHRFVAGQLTGLRRPLPAAGTHGARAVHRRAGSIAARRRVRSGRRGHQALLSPPDHVGSRNHAAGRRRLHGAGAPRGGWRPPPAPPGGRAPGPV